MKKHAKTSVLKRILAVVIAAAVAYRLNKDCICSGYDIVFVARVTAKDKGYHEIESAMMHLFRLKKLTIVRDGEN